MEQLWTALDMIVHLDVYLKAMIESFGIYTYLIIFLLIFCETGLVVTPFLPGDSLLFIAGAFAAVGMLDIYTLFILIFIAAVLGNTVNYQIGYLFGTKIVESRKLKLINAGHIEKTHRYFEKYGPRLIILSRFLPIVRTFAPFVAGMGKMEYRRFTLYNIVGALVWTVILLLGGYFFGNIEIVRNNFSNVIMILVVVPLIPTALELLRNHRQRKK